MALPNNAIELLLGGLTDPTSTAKLLAQLAPAPELVAGSGSLDGSGGAGSPAIGDFVNPTTAGAPAGTQIGAGGPGAGGLGAGGIPVGDLFKILQGVQGQSGASGDPGINTPGLEGQAPFTIPDDIFAAQQNEGIANDGSGGTDTFSAANIGAALKGLSGILGAGGGAPPGPLRIPNAPPPPQGRGNGTANNAIANLQNAVAPAARAVNGQIPSLAQLILGR